MDDKEIYGHLDDILKYVEDVKTGKIITSKYVKQAVERFEKDIEKSNNRNYHYYFDAEKAAHIITFTELLKQYQDGFSGQRLKLEPWQKFILGNIYGWVKKKDRTRRFSKAFVFVGRKNGKALALDTPINTPNGLTTMGEIHSGDFVYGDDGRPVEVLWESEIHYNHDCYKMEFSNGDVIVADADHLWTIKSHYGRKEIECLKTYTTEELFNKFSKGYTLRVPKGKPIQGNHRNDLFFSPYTLGVWLGDGASASTQISVGDRDIDELTEILVNEYVRLGLNFDGVNNYRLNITPGEKNYKGTNDFSNYLREKNLLNNKHIPEEYFYSSYQQRLSLLQGLMDTDGSVNKKGQVEWAQKSDVLTNDFCKLLDTFCIKYTKTSRAIKCNGKECFSYRITFFTDLPIFRIKRKLERLRPLNHRSDFISIKKIEKVESVPTKCIAVNNDSHLFCIGYHNTITHNSTLMASCLLYDLLLTPGAQCYSAATKRDQSKIIYNVLEQFIKQNEVLFGKLKLYPSSSRIVHPYKAGFYEAMSSESDKMDGLNPSTVVVDEVSAMKNYDIIKVLQSGQGSRPEPLLIEITSGSDDIYSAGKQEFDRSVKILDGSLVDDSFFCILYCIDEGDDWKDSKNDIKANPNLNISIKQEFLDKMRTEALQQPSLEGEFRSKNLGEYVSPISSWIHHSNWEKVMTDEPFPTENFISVGAVDLSKRNDFTAYTIYAYSFNTNKYYAKHMFYFPENQIQEKMKTDSELIKKWIELGLIKPTKGYTVDYRELYKDILDSLEKYKVREICYDPYNSLTLQTEIEPYVDLIEINQGIKSMSPMAKGFEESVLKQEIVDNNPILSWMVENATVYTDANGNIKVQKPSTSSSSKRVDGVITSIMALERLKKLIQDGVDLRTPEEIEEDMESLLGEIDY